MPTDGNNAPKLAIIGFGEAGPAIASGLHDDGLSDITAYDILLADTEASALLAERAAKAGVALCANHADAVQGRDIVISTVTCADAVTAAGQVAPHLKAGQIYLDVNSVSPVTKAEVRDVIEASGATFVEASIMSPIYPNRHKSPMLACGPAAPALISALAPFGMDIEDMGSEFGRAAATKMFRSIVFKGLEALLGECVVAADQYGVAEKVLDSVGKNYPQLDWNDLASYFMGRSIAHGVRRAHEMDEVAETLKAMDMQPFMAEGAAKRIRWLGTSGLKEHFAGREPENYHEIVAVLKQLRGG
jgi:3-hydroxyisobutyrate dehydrogenase-like beta-hydroxyacid dehydrogenase